VAGFCVCVRPQEGACVPYVSVCVRVLMLVPVTPPGAACVCACALRICSVRDARRRQDTQAVASDGCTHLHTCSPFSSPLS
jgi:hypothetical protein